MRTIYNGVELMDCRTQVLDVSPEYDPSAGIDKMRTKIRLVVQGVVNPQSMAYTVGGLTAGTRAGLTLVNIRQALTTPRQFLQVYIGADLVFASPGINPNTNQPYKADSGNGPLPHQGVYVTEGNILGDRTIIANFGVDFWVMGASNIVLSNRWECRHSTNHNGMTTRTLRGTAVVRADAIAAGLIESADDFRAALVVAQPLNFERASVDVTQEEDGAVIHYTVVDRETLNSLGSPGQPTNIFHVEGSATAGFDSRLKSSTDYIDFGAGEAKQFGAILGMSNPLSIALGIFGMGHTFLTSVLPIARGRAMFRVEGGRNVSRSTLARLAARICSDRSAGGMITSLYFTQIHSEIGQACECRMEWMPTATQFAAALPFAAKGGLEPDSYMNMNNNYSQPTFNPPLNYPNTGRTPNNPLPRGFGTRGDYVQQMAFQALSTPNNAPPAVPNVDGANGAVTDLNVIQ